MHFLHYLSELVDRLVHVRQCDSQGVDFLQVFVQAGVELLETIEPDTVMLADELWQLLPQRQPTVSDLPLIQTLGSLHHFLVPFLLEEVFRPFMNFEGQIHVAEPELSADVGQCRRHQDEGGTLLAGCDGQDGLELPPFAGSEGTVVEASLHRADGVVDGSEEQPLDFVAFVEGGQQGHQVELLFSVVAPEVMEVVVQVIAEVFEAVVGQWGEHLPAMLVVGEVGDQDLGLME